MAAGVLAINEAIEKPDSADLLLALKSKSVALKSITPECADGYHRELKDTKDKKDDVGEWLFLKKSYKWGGNYQFEVHKKIYRTTNMDTLAVSLLLALNSNPFES